MGERWRMKKERGIDFISGGIWWGFGWSLFENGGGYKRKVVRFGLER